MSRNTLLRRNRRSSRRKRKNGATTFGLASLCLLAFLLFPSRVQATTWVDQPADPGQKFVGIQLGSSESRVGVVRSPGGSVDILASKSGQNYIPSYIVATDAGLLAGEAAREHGGLNLFRALLDIKTYLADDNADGSRIHLPGYIHSYTMQDNEQVLQIDYNGTCHSLTPEEIFAPLLAELRDIGISHLGPGRICAVVATPFPYDESTTAQLERAGEGINMPILRHAQETSMTLRALGLDDLSHESERYALVYDLEPDFQTLTIKIVEIDNGIIDTLSTFKARIKSHDVEEADIERLLDENFKWDQSHISKREVLQTVEARLHDITMDSILAAVKSAGLTLNQITDLIFMPPTNKFRSIQRYWGPWFQTKWNKNIKVANTDSLNIAPVHGAVLVAYSLQDNEIAGWVPCSCDHYRPPVGIGTADGVVDVLSGCYRLPAHATQTLRASSSCGGLRENGDRTTVQVYFRDVPSLDYFHRLELGEEYIHDVLSSNVLLGSFEIDTTCDDMTNPPLLDVSILMSRDSFLKIEIVNTQTRNTETLTFPALDFRCGSDNRYSDGGRYNYTHGSHPTMGLEREYEMDLKGFMGPSGWETVVDAFDTKLLGGSV
ncbi:Hsp70 protein-domain-containing protein [Aspergillus venezuelensis]